MDVYILEFWGINDNERAEWMFASVHRTRDGALAESEHADFDDTDTRVRVSWATDANAGPPTRLRTHAHAKKFTSI